MGLNSESQPYKHSQARQLTETILTKYTSGSTSEEIVLLIQPSDKASPQASKHREDAYNNYVFIISRE